MIIKTTIIKFFFILLLLNTTLHATTKGITPSTVNINQIYKVYWNLNGNLSSRYDLRVTINGKTYKLHGGPKNWYINFRSSVAGKFTFYFKSYKDGSYYNSYGSATVTVRINIVSSPSINSVKASPSTVRVGDKITFYGYLSKSLSSGYSAYLEFVDAGFKKKMSCYNRTCSYSKNMQQIGNNRRFRVRIEKNGSLIKSKYGYYSVKSKTVSKKPTISYLSPNELEATNSYQNLYIKGSSFTSSSQVYVNWGSGWHSYSGSSKGVYYQNSSQIKFRLRTTTGASGTWRIKVKNGLYYSNEKSFKIKSIIKTPIITSISPNRLTEGEKGKYLYIYGKNFTDVEKVYIEGVVNTTNITKYSSSKLKVYIPEVYGSKNNGYRDITIKFKNGKRVIKSNLLYVKNKIVKNNTPPIHQKTYTNQTPTQNKPFYIYSKWSDSDGDYIINVKIRYKKEGSNFWKTVTLDYDKDTTFKKQLTLSNSGTYDIQVQASDAKKLDGSTLHTPNWLSVNSIKVKAKSLTALEITKFDKKKLLATNNWQYLTLYGDGFSSNSKVEWKSGNYNGFIPNNNTWASTNKIKIKLKTTINGKGTWQFRVKDGYRYSNWKSIKAISSGGSGNHLQAYLNAVGGTCPKGGIWITDQWNFYKCECTSYVAWKMNQQGISGFNNGYKGGHFGNAKNWATNAKNIGWSVSKTPTAGSIANSTNSTYGHVAYVEAVNGNMITISEYNKNFDHTYTTRTVSSSSFNYYITPSTTNIEIKPKIYSLNKNQIDATYNNQFLVINGENFTNSSTIEWKWSSKSGSLKHRPQFISNNQLKIAFNTQGGAGEWSFRVKNGNQYSNWVSIVAKIPKTINKPTIYNYSKTQSNNNINISFYAYDEDGDLDRVEIYWDGYNGSNKKVITSNLSNKITASHTYQTTTDKISKTIYIYAYDKAGHISVQRTLPVYISSKYQNTNINKEKVAKSTCGGVGEGLTIGTATGAEMMTLSLLQVKGLHNISFDLSYNSLLLTDNTIDKGWNHNFGFTSYIETKTTGDIKVYWDDGHYNTFIRQGGSHRLFSNDRTTKFDILQENSDGSFTLIRQNRVSYFYSKDGKIKNIKNYKNQALNFSFDDNGRIQRVTDVTSGVYLDYAYNSHGRLYKVSDELGREVILSYNSSNQLIKIQAPEEISYLFEYSSDLGQLYKVTYGDGTPYYKQTYNSKGQVISEDDGKGDNQLAKFSYKDNGSTLTTNYTNKLGKETIYKYTTNDFKLLSMIDAKNGKTTNSYYSNGKLKSTTNAKGYTTKFEYDNSGNRVKTIFADGSYETMSYDNHRNLLSHTIIAKDGNSFTTRNSYDAQNNLIQTTLPNGETTKYTYNSNNQLSSITSPKGYITKYNYEKGRLKRVTNSKNQSVVYEYDIVGRMVKKTDPLGNTTSYIYDSADRLIKIINPQGGISTFSYDSRGNKIAKSDPMGNISTYEYDNNNNLISSTNALGATTTYNYDGEDRLVKTTNALGRSSQIIYDSIGSVTKTIDTMGNSHRIEYDALGNVKKEYDSYGNMINSYSYDSKNRLIEAIDILNNKTTTSYNVLNQPATISDPLNRVSQFSYDKVGRVILAIDALGGRTTQTFDQEGNRVSFTDPNINQTSFEYDSLGNIIRETTASGSTNSYVYNANSQPIRVTNGRGQTKNISYTKTGAVSSISDSEGTINYSYDKNGNILSIYENGKTITYTYDVLNRLTSYTDTEGNRISYGYDILGNLISLGYPDGKVVQYRYNANNQLISVIDWNSNQTNYEYDKNGRLIKTTLPNGTYTTRTYDSAGRLLKQYTYPDLSSFIFEYDKVGNIIKEENSEEISPKALANIQMQYTKGNLISGSTITFDKDDNMLTLDNLSLSYDSRNRLTKANSTTYLYNSINHRISKTTNGNITKYITNPNAPLSQLLIQIDSDGSKTYYIYGLGLISQIKNGQTLYYHYDLRGSTIALTNSSGQITDKFSYLPYGELYKHSKGSTNTPFLYNGRDGVMREENDLYYMRARYYSTKIKRFINRDILIGEVGNFGSLNRFGYVNGNLVIGIDPLGLYWGESVVNTTCDIAWDWTIGGPINECIINASDNWNAGIKFTGAEAWYSKGASGLVSYALNCGSEIAKPAKVLKKGKKAFDVSKKIKKTVKKIHKNNNNYIGNQKQYTIKKYDYNTQKSSIYKIGTTSDDYLKNGHLKRPWNQVRKLNQSSKKSYYYYGEDRSFYGSTRANKIIENTRIRTGKIITEKPNFSGNPINR